MKIAFIINPIAGKNRKKDIVPIIKQYFNKSKYKYCIKYTKGIRDAEIITKKFLNDGYRIIVAVGGDGTIKEVSNGIIDRNEGILGIIPMGTGNDLVRTLDIPLDIDKSIKRIINGQIKEINIANVKNDIFLNVFSIGIDAEIVENTKIFKSFFSGKLAYTMGILRTLFMFKSKNIVIECNGEKIEKEILLVAVGNGRYYGGGMKICPMADITDDKLDICIIKNMSKWKILFLFPLAFNGKHKKLKKYVRFIKASSLRIYSKNKLLLNIDGEINTIQGNIDIHINMRRLKVLI
ncbi:diacylglycerol kinase family lipid kinase [Clostridium sp. D2Q-14]|uniref:diacylglycerol/lipid kinase family protein n=1 Tax=Anaeromonas gelatinilytica TaxID=2683194 RepID=UPI00193BD5F1|nr:diacylglycerol kinase family protein [Anaeromonas gelatinilytica]MBS4534529.1 diacylglycerol kinase family lipid kinase [Anaeromonas gelatinilytica]